MVTIKSVYRLAWLLALSACAQVQDPASGGSESHFLTCEHDNECGVLGSEFQCVAGQCQDPSAIPGPSSNEDDPDADGDVSLTGSGGSPELNTNGGAGGVAGSEDSIAQGGVGGESNAVDTTAGANCGDVEEFEPLVPSADEVCYDLMAHNGGGEGDPFIVSNEESISQVYYDIPWPEGTVATRFGASFDNLTVIHQWLLFSLNDTDSVVQHNVTGTTLGQDAKILGAWNIGGCNVTLPPDMGLELPDPTPGKRLMVQWHHYNYTGAPAPDASAVQICTVSRSTRPNIGGITVLGTEDLGSGAGMPPDAESKFSGTCLNETSEPITIVGFRPSMRYLGTNMYSEITRASDGEVEPVFDQPFVFDNQVHYMMEPTVVMQPGDKIRSECTFFNNTAANVSFGVSVHSETCSQYVFSYPAGALDKPENATLIGATNTCWGD